MLEVQTPLPSGTVIQERFIVESLLGKGDFGSIYLVRDQHKKRKLFVLAEVFNPNEEESYRFTLEYAALTPIDHQALPGVQYVFNDDKLCRAYLLMSYFEEPNLEILRLYRSEQRFSLSQVMALMRPVINAVTYLHHQSPPVIHRNIKPAIIIPTIAKGSALIMLSILKEYDSTTTTLHYLTPGYGATEQYEEEYSTRTDIYGLGATFYTLLTGIIPPDALYRSTELNNGEADPLKPLNEVIPIIPTFMAEALQRAMSIQPDDRFPGVQQFEQALKAGTRFQESSSPKLRRILPEMDLSLEADSDEQKPLEPMIAPTGTTQTNPAEQKSPKRFTVPLHPITVPLHPTIQQAPGPEIPPLRAVTEEPPAFKTVPLPVLAEEPPVPEVVSSAPTQSPVIPEKTVAIPAESLPGKTRTALSREPGTLEPASSRQTFEKPAAASAPKQPRAWKLGVLQIVLALLIGFGISVVLWSDIPSHPIAHSGARTPGVKSPTLIPSPASSIYPMLTRMYSGTIYDLSVNVSSSMVLSGIQQSQGKISGYLTLGPKMQGSVLLAEPSTTLKN